MLIPHALRIDPNPFDRQHPILLTQPPTIQLIIRNDPQKHKPQRRGQQSRRQKHDFPGLDVGSVLAAADGDAVREQAAEDLREPVEAEPDAGSAALLFGGVPLGREECEAGRYGGFEDAEEETDCDCAGEVLDSREAREDYAPHYDIEGRCVMSVSINL